MTDRERAIDIMFKLFGSGLSRGMIEKMTEDPTDTGATLRTMLETLADGIKADRAECARARLSIVRSAG